MPSRILLLLALLFTTTAYSDDAPPTAKPGHSANGDAFDEGPRQFARFIPGATAVHFEVKTKSPEAQRFFDQGVTQLHGFWYFEAERSFRQVAYLDPDCAMAYWGMAMANVNNEKRAEGFIKEATKRQEKATPREQKWIDMWAAFFSAGKKDDKPRREALVKAYENLLYDFPDDIEARALLVLQLWDNADHGIPIPSRLAVAALAEQVLAKSPMHPGSHHYLIHLWNSGEDRRALADAARCGQSAPGIAHLWHMSGHTYSSLKRYADAAWQQEASARVDHAYMREARILPEQIHNYAHNNDWLAKNLGYIGRVHDGVALAKNLIELPRLGPEKERAWRLGRDRLLQLGLDFELWDELTASEATPYLAADPNPAHETARLRALGVAWYAKGTAPRGDEKLRALEAQLAYVRADRYAAADKAETEAKEAHKSEGDTAKAMADAMRGFAGRLAGLENALGEVRAARALAAGDKTKAREELAKAKDLPPVRAARMRLALGDLDQAESLAREAIKSDAGQTLPYALLAATLTQAGKTEAATQAFNQLRERSADLDLDLPAFVRLAPIATRLSLPLDWRVAKTVATDVGQRPQLDELGPFRWSPYHAPVFSLSDQNHEPVSLESRRGRPVLVLFYLGAGCAKCMEQLNRFAPMAEAYKEAGIEIIAVSTDTPEGLHETFDQAKGGHGFPFKVVSDSSRDAFRAYRAFDDFESIALHGAFLIDGAGDVRWQNISFEPFTDAAWLLEEAKRLLALPGGEAKIAAGGEE